MARVNPPSEQDTLRMHLTGRQHRIAVPARADLRTLAIIHCREHVKSEVLSHTHHVESPLLRIPALVPDA